tara:strand:- start:1274 stop:1579 length:306 start_codon:yes stop_codon:yes gene_type:complete
MKKTINDITTDEWDTVGGYSKQQNLFPDNVNAPFHYNAGKIECIESIKASMSIEAFKGYLKGNCQKYLWRFDYKGKAKEDLQKASWYLNKLITIVAAEEKK